VDKSASKEGKNGGKFMVWKVSDLTKVTRPSGKQPLQETTLFLFGAAYNDFWREDVGAVFGIRDANVREDVSARQAPPSSYPPKTPGRRFDVSTCRHGGISDAGAAWRLGGAHTVERRRTRKAASA
jgi:hypothetical protein